MILSQFVLPDAVPAGRGLDVLSNRLRTYGIDAGLLTAIYYVPARALVTALFSILVSSNTVKKYLMQRKGNLLASACLGIISSQSFARLHALTLHLLQSFQTYSILAVGYSPTQLYQNLKSRADLPGVDLSVQFFPVLTGLFAGYPLSFVGTFGYRLAFHAINKQLRSLPFNNKLTGSRTSSMIRWGLTFISTTAASFVVYPLDTIRGYQVFSAFNGGDMGLLQTVQFIYENGGILGFFAGFHVQALAGFAGTALLFAESEWKNRY